jgi:hypothetical protein
MLITFKIRRIVLLALCLALVENAAGYFVFRALGDLCTVRREEVTKLISDEQDKVENSASPTEVRIIEGPNGSEEVFITSSISLGINVRTSGEAVRFYMERLIDWEMLEDLVNLVRDVYERMFEATLCTLCAVLLASRFGRLPRSPMPI